MTKRYAPPPVRELPTERRRQLGRHLTSEIALNPPRTTTRNGVTGRLASRVAVAAAAVAALVVVTALIGTRAGTESASAADVRAKLAEGLTLDVTIRGALSVRTRDPGPRPRGARVGSNAPLQVPVPSRFVVAPDGSYASRSVTRDVAGMDRAYDASTGIETSVFPAGRGEVVYLRATNLDPVQLADNLPYAHLGAWVQGALADRDPRVREVRFDGRPAWKLTVTFTPGESFYESYGARVDVVVDRDTGLVRQLVQYAYDTNRWTSIATVRELELGTPTTAREFTLAKPARAKEISHDYGFQRVPIPRAAAIIGYRPLLPTNTLGRSLTDFAVARTSAFPFPGIPVRRDMASARYGRGAAAIAISSYRGPLVDLTSILGVLTAETVHPTQGPLAGGVAYASTSPLSAAVVAAYADGLLVRITAPSTSDALTVANSLRAVP